MKKFILKFTGFLAIGAFTFFSIFSFTEIIVNLNYKKHRNALYVWGDSQIFRGLDLSTFGVPVFSAAHVGAGVYDFLTFTERVPNNSTVLVGYSKMIFTRPKNSDYNRSGLSIKGLTYLYQNGYTVHELIELVSNNLLPKKHYDNRYILFDVNELTILNRPDSTSIKANFLKCKLDLENKKNLFSKGIENLTNKNCRIMLVEFPYHDIFRKIEADSDVTDLLEQLGREVSQRAKIVNIDSIEVPEYPNPMYDLVHLNSRGSSFVSRYISNQITDLSQTKSRFIVFHINKSTQITSATKN